MIISKFLYQLIDKPISGEWGTEGGTVNVIRTANFTNQGIIDFSKVVTRNIEDKKIIIKKLKEHDIIIEKSGGSPDQPVGRVVYFDKKGLFLCNNFTSILRPKQELIFPKYLSTYKEVIGNLNPIISCHINDLSVDNFPVSTYITYFLAIISLVLLSSFKTKLQA